MHAVHYTSCGGGPSDLKVTSISISFSYSLCKSYLFGMKKSNYLSLVQFKFYIYFFLSPIYKLMVVLNLQFQNFYFSLGRVYLQMSLGKISPTYYVMT